MGEHGLELAKRSQKIRSHTVDDLHFVLARVETKLRQALLQRESLTRLPPLATVQALTQVTHGSKHRARGCDDQCSKLERHNEVVTFLVGRLEELELCTAAAKTDRCVESLLLCSTRGHGNAQNSNNLLTLVALVIESPCEGQNPTIQALSYWEAAIATYPEICGHRDETVEREQWMLQSYLADGSRIFASKEQCDQRVRTLEDLLSPSIPYMSNFHADLLAPNREFLEMTRWQVEAIKFVARHHHRGVIPC